MVAAEGQELNLQREEGTGAREPLPGTWTLLSAPNKSKFLVQTSSCSALTIHPHCWAEAPHLVTAALPGTVVSPKKDNGKALEAIPQG